MRILFDASSMPRRRAGAGMVMYHLGRALAIHARQHPLRLIDRFGTFNDLVELPGVTLNRAPRFGRALRVGWEQMALPVEARRWRADILHGLHHSLPLAPTVAASVVTVHDLTFDLLPGRYTFARRWYMRIATRLGLHRADRVIVPSGWVRRLLVDRYGVAESRVEVIPLAPPPGMAPVEDFSTRDQIRRRYALPERFIFSVGTLEPGKNRGVTVEALDLLRGRGVDLPLVIAGQAGWHADGIPGTSLGRVRRLGYVPDADLPGLYSVATAFVFPSLLEGFGLPPLEAMACGTPVIASHRPAMPEVLGDAALYAGPSAVREWAGAIERVVSDDHLRVDLVQRGLARAARFSWNRAATATLAVYESAIAHRASVAVQGEPAKCR